MHARKRLGRALIVIFVEALAMASLIFVMAYGVPLGAELMRTLEIAPPF
ncbi:hypothetical protein [Pseudomonas massiliensis]|nr:hypothetical protein [Pseudomonas massiliensis]